MILHSLYQKWNKYKSLRSQQIVQQRIWFGKKMREMIQLILLTVRRFEEFIFFVVLVSLGVVLYQREHPSIMILGRDVVEMTVFDVGQGDAILVEAGPTMQMLVDGGPDATVLAKLGEHMPARDQTIELVVLTHPHIDHLVGLIEVLKRYRVEKIMMPDLGSATAEYQAFEEMLTVLNTPREYIIEGKFNFGNLEVALLFPDTREDARQANEPNDASVVMMLEIGQQKILLTGDIEADGEGRMQSDGDALNADVLKVAHHGSKSSTTQPFLKTVSPRQAIISVGNNDYGHPHAEVLRRLDQAGVRVLRTDRQGDIVVRTDGRDLTVTSER